ncbi:MAG: hypothetical protein M3Z01_05025, partial [Thermoproteota archaeon]|nr:hypothetical protein [Thermoproteota archaeon]
LVKIYQELKNNFPLFFHLYRGVKREGLNKQYIADLLQNQQRLVDMEKRVMLYNDHIQGLLSQKLQLKKEIDALRTKRDNYDGIFPL